MCLFDLIILMIACHRRMNIKMIQQPQAIARILRCDQVDLLQNPEHPHRDILQIADRRRAQIQLSSLLAHEIFPFLSV